jgi:hypothetical protein
MSEHGFHVHGPHDHEMEHAARHDPEGHAGQLAVTTAILATVGALFAYMGGATQSHAGLSKNDAAISKTAASNQWNYFQAKSTKQSLAELARDMAPDDKKAFYQSKVDRYEKEKNEIKAEADKLEAQAKAFDEQSETQLHEHHTWAQATTALQIAIALAAIALLTKRRWMEYAVYGVSVVGVGLGAAAWFHWL